MEQNLSWLAIQTIGRREVVAASNLASASIETFLPLLRRRIETRFQKYHTVDPLFPCYLFARFDIADWPLIRREQGVRVVRTGERPALVEDWVIEGLRSRMNELGYAEAVPSTPVRTIYPPIKRGTPVVMQKGAWTGLTGIFAEGLSGGERVAVLMRILGAERRVVLSRGDVEPLPQTAAGYVPL